MAIGFPDLFLEQCRQMSYYSNLGLFWEVMAPAFEMSDIYDEGGFKGVPDAMNFLVNGLCDRRSSHLPPRLYSGRMLRNHPEIKGFMWLLKLLTYVEAVARRSGVQSLTMPRRSKSLTIKRLSLRNSMLMYSQWVSWHSAHTANAGYVALPAAISGGLLPATLPGQR